MQVIALVPDIGIAADDTVGIAEKIIGGGTRPAGDLPFFQGRQPDTGPAAIGLDIV